MDGIRVLLVDDQEIMVRGLRMILESEDGIEVVATAGNGEEACRLCRAARPDVVLMDVKMPVLNGVEATARIKRECPGVKVLILTTFNDDEYIFEALKEGASGYLLKDASPDTIAGAIRAVHRGGAPIQPEVASRVVARFSSLAASAAAREIRDERVGLLTEREREIAGLVGRGLNNREIAGRLFLSEGTVRNHVSNILNKLELRDRTQLAIFALRHRLTEDPGPG
jgi:DNA-binding NarL/FixJ family response regulator